MDLAQLNSIATTGKSAASTVASALSSRRAVQTTPKDTTTSTSSTTSASNAANSSNITSNDFLTLLVSELKNQDPTNAMDPPTFTNELISLTGVEQQEKTNTQLSTIASTLCFRFCAPM